MYFGLKHSNVAATLAVRDIHVARRFYEDVLGLQVETSEDGHAVTYIAGDARLLVYVSPYAGTNRATAATWPVGDLKATVFGLRAKGVRFEHYEQVGVRIDGDIHAGPRIRVAWFKDPDGNLHALVQD